MTYRNQLEECGPLKFLPIAQAAHMAGALLAISVLPKMVKDACKSVGVPLTIALIARSPQERSSYRLRLGDHLGPRELHHCIRGF